MNREHVHVWIHVASTNWRGRPVLVCKCACGRKLTPAQILAMREEMGVA